MFPREQHLFSIKWHAAFSDRCADFLALTEKYIREYDPLDDTGAEIFLSDYENIPDVDDFLQEALRDSGTPGLLLDALYLCCKQIQEEQDLSLSDEEQERSRQWFLALLDSAAYLSSANNVPFCGTPQEMTLTSHRAMFSCLPEPWEELVQMLVIEQGGKVSFCSNAPMWDAQGTRSTCRREFMIEPTASQTILQEIAAHFSVPREDDYILDAGGWDLELTNTAGKSFLFSGSLWEGENGENARLSQMIRTLVGMRSLNAFDEDAHPENALRRVILTHTLHPVEEGVPESSQTKQNEQLIVDAASESIEYSFICGDIRLCFQSEFPDGVSRLLDQYSMSGLFCRPAPLHSDFAEPPFYVSEYRLTAIYEDGSQQMSQGFYEKRELPACFASFMKKIAVKLKQCINFGIFDPSLYGQSLPRQTDPIYCEVVFIPGGKTYYYRTEDDSLMEGDEVVVPAGKDNHLSIAKITEVNYFPPDSVPFPIEKTKMILRRCTPEDYEQLGGEKHPSR